MRNNTEDEFRRLGGAIALARVDAGLAKQSDLAKMLGVSQQTVSRWEAGVARPREKQLFALAVVLKLNVADLRRLAHDEGVPAVSYVEPFPVDRLDPVTFESFTADLVAVLHPHADVRRAGGTGHMQDGLDVEAAFSDRRRIGFQCKRVQRFGPADAKAAIAAFSAIGIEKVLVLSSIASPQTAKTVEAAGWTMWDKDDLSRRVRSLPIEAQERLVDTYFRGQRLALLGRSEPGPWLTVSDFFRPFEGFDPLLSHDWDLLGRESEVDDLLAALARPGVRMVLLVAAGGMGKSRLLKEVAAILARREPTTRVRFLLPSADLTRGVLEDLGPGPKVIVVDDAHDRDKLVTLFQHAADPSRQVRIVLATRPYALDRIQREAVGVNLTSPPTIELKVLKRRQLLALAEQILSRFGFHDEGYARYVVAASGGSPLIVAMASRALAKDRIPVEIAQNEETFRKAVFSRFEKIAFHTANDGEEKVHKDVLDLLALVQPFHPEDRQLLDALERVQGVSGDMAFTVLSRFEKGGATYQRGHEWRLMPDVLGDYLIETSCRGAGGRLSRFAERALDVVKGTLFKHALINLGRLDWRLNAGATADSALLGEVWREFEKIDDEYDPRLDAIESIALYQPSQALDFVARQVRRKRKLRAFPAILRGIAQSGNYLPEVMTLLWELGRYDDRELGPHPDHPIRVLSELGDYGLRKPLVYSEALLRFGLSLAVDVSNWKGRYTPLDVLKPLLSLEGTDNLSDGRTITLRSYFIDYKTVKPIREAVIDKLIELLRHPLLHIARSAGLLLQDASRYPLGLMGSTPPKGLEAALSREFTRTFERVLHTMAQGVAPLVALAVARSVSWNAKYGTGRSSTSAQKILSNLPNDIDFRVMSLLIDGWGTLFSDCNDYDDGQAALDRRLVEVASDLYDIRPNAIHRLLYIQRLLSQITEAGEDRSSAHMLFCKLVQDDAFSRVTIDDALAQSTSVTRRYVGIALAQLMRGHKEEGRSYARRLVDSGDRELSIGAVQAYSANQIEADDRTLIQTLLGSHDPGVVHEMLRAVWLWQAIDDRERVRLLLEANYAQSINSIDALAMVLCSKGTGCLDVLTEIDVAKLLQSILTIENLEGYWIDDLLASLSYRFPLITADFLMRRVEIAEERESYSFRAANFGPYSRKPLRFLESSEAAGVLERVWRWLRENCSQKHYFHYAAAHMMEAMFLKSTDMIVDFFRPRLPAFEKPDLEIVGRIFREADHGFVFAQVKFTTELLDRCQAVDSDLCREVASQLYASERSGIRTSILGEPSPRDLVTRDNAERVLAGLSRLSPAYELFNDIRRSALADIDRAKRDAEALDG